MIVYRITSPQYALERTGIGARENGGRWNGVGLSAIYAASTIELSALEKLVHLNTQSAALTLTLVEISLPNKKSLYRYANLDQVPDWNALYPYSSVSYGNHFLQQNEFLGMFVPSVIVPESLNILLNPNHREWHKVSFNVKRPFQFDMRLIQTQN